MGIIEQEMYKLSCCKTSAQAKAIVETLSLKALELHAEEAVYRELAQFCTDRADTCLRLAEKAEEATHKADRRRRDIKSGETRRKKNGESEDSGE